MQVRLLGPVDLAVNGAPRPVSGLRRKALLAALALRAGETVSVDWLIDVVWGNAAPPTAVNTLQRHVSHLRDLLGSRAAIRAQPPGYVLDLGADATDVAVAERLIAQALGASDAGQRARQLRAALGLWRGRALLDVAGPVWLAEQADRLDQMWLHGTRALAETRLLLGEHAQLVPELEALIRDRPFDEALHRLLILALYGSGRQADALQAYRRLRRSLADELGIDPSQPLRDLQAAMLRQDPELNRRTAPVDWQQAGLDPPTTGRSVTDPPTSGAPVTDVLPAGVPATDVLPAGVPAQLPMAVPAFAGRGSELARLDALVAEPAPGTVVISAVSGTAGVGKTALAVHWAHRVAERFPDGQLYVNLRGFDPGVPVLDTAAALRGFLEALGVPAQRIPSDPQTQAGLYRSLLSGKRVLVVLDNARDVAQVRPLLPGTPGCLAIVTSRNQLTGLVATEGAYPLNLDLLTIDEARDFVLRRLGAERVAGQLPAVDDIIARCARLPLALALVTARAATRPGFPLGVLADELRDAASALDAFHGGHPSSDIRAVFACSYRTLSPAAARLFRLLGDHPGPDVGAPAAASMAGVGPEALRPLLAELTRVHLLTEHSPGRYVLHDLLRAYAVELAGTHDGDANRRAATTRLLDHYLHTAHPARLLLQEPAFPLDPGQPRPGVTAERIADTEQAASWFAAERPVLLAAIDRAAALGLDRHAYQLATTLSADLDVRGSWHDALAVLEPALAAARRLGDELLQARSHRAIAFASVRLHRDREAHRHLHLALDLFERLDDLEGQAWVHEILSRAYESQGRYADALRHVQRALALFQTAGLPARQAIALNGVGWCYALLGQYELALESCTAALDLLDGSDHLADRADTLDSVGFARHHLGDHAGAVRAYAEAVQLWREAGMRYGEADTLKHLGDTYRATGDLGPAREAWQRSLDLLVALDNDEADQLRERLAEADALAPG